MILPYDDPVFEDDEEVSDDSLTKELSYYLEFNTEFVATYFEEDELNYEEEDT